MIKRLLPSLLAESIYDIPASFYLSRGIKVILTDLDNTLDDYRTKEPGDKAKNLVKSFKENGISLFVASNNSSKRVRHYCGELGIDYCGALYKPFHYKLDAWIKKKGFRKEEVAFVGDQIFTDSISARGAKLFMILVEPFHPERDSPLTWLNRLLERPIRAKITKKHLVSGWKEAQE